MERWKEISKIFNAALEIEPERRGTFLAEACGDDERLRAEIETLLAAHEGEDSILDSVEIGLARRRRAREMKKGERIASFEIESLIGTGGMGEVYLARDTRLNRPVAIKILPPSSASDLQAKRRLLREAKSAAALEHPHICTIHEIGEENGLSFIVMQYVEGKTLSEILQNRPLNLFEALNFAVQITEALSEAHAHNVIHRDVKPANIVISAHNQVKVLDFGLAKKVLTESLENREATGSLISQPGLILGTASYMSPEQTRGETVDARTDIWSLGVVLYEMVTGETPFAGTTVVDKLVAILHDEPEFSDYLPGELKEIIKKALAKDREKRYQTADELLGDLKNLKEEIEFEEKLKTHASVTADALAAKPRTVKSKPKTFRRQLGWQQLVFYGVLAGLLALGGWYWRRNSQITWAKESVRRVEELARAEKNFEAYDLALEIEKYLPDDDALTGLMPTISNTLTVSSTPAGARVYLKGYSPDGGGKFSERRLIGETPIENLRIARGQYVLQVEKDGYAVFERTISDVIPRIGGSFIESPPVKIETKLLAAGQVPDWMTYVPVGVPSAEYSLVNWSRPTQKQVHLDGFFIDKYEVSNKDFKEFITSGGYLKKEFWKFPFVKSGKEIALEEAVKEFKDRTGLPAPRQWSNQNYPEGKAEYPVTDITWYEAAAYAEFRGKRLPTVFQWEKAARDGAFDPRYNAMPWGFIKQGETTNNRANFSSTTALPVRSLEFGMSPYGVYNMAGNVSEWCLNRSGNNFVTSGGAWNDLPYSFGDYGEYPGFYSSDKLGFRCVLNLPDATGDQGAEPLPPPEIPVYQASGEIDYKMWLTHYDYDKNPLHAQIIETQDGEAWTREKITFAGENGEQAIAYLYLPKNYARPLQVVHYLPPGDVVAGLRYLPDSVEMFLTPVLKSGRAVFTVVLKGYNQRPFPPNYVPPERTTVEFRKQAVNWMTDLRRGLDYLETRPEVDFKKLSFLGISNGANLGLLTVGVERRYNSAVFIGVGVDKEWRNWIPEANFINFAPHARMPKLLVHGRYDETHPLATFLEPLYKLMNEPKKLVIYDGGHIPTIEFLATSVNGWLDEKYGTPAK
jgi:serine/threonine protein kinase/formylglycine-generating enzyme required for sulfatase activity